MQYDHNATPTTITASATSPNSWMAATYDEHQHDDNIKVEKPIAASKATEKSKRKQVKNACVNCQKACKKCDDGRPCKRCVKLGLTATCRDSDRKERKKGVKRGPYKKRQAYIKDKPVYPKLTEEEHWKQPIYENVPQVLSQCVTQSMYSDFYDDNAYCVPSQRHSLSPTSSSSFVDESDERLHYAFGYGYTNNTITTTSSPSTISMLDHNQTLSGNVTPISYSWDDNVVDNYSSSISSPIGCSPIVMNNSDASIVQFQPFPTTTDIIYQTQQKKDISSSIIIQQQPSFDFNMLSMPTTANTAYWYNEMPLEYQQPIIPQQQQHYFEYSIPSQQELYPAPWTYTN